MKLPQITCPKCGGYMPGHASGGADICECEPIFTGNPTTMSTPTNPEHTECSNPPMTPEPHQRTPQEVMRYWRDKLAEHRYSETSCRKHKMPDQAKWHEGQADAIDHFLLDLEHCVLRSTAPPAPTPPADAPEPPWAVAANELAQFEPHHGQLSDGGQWFRRVGSIVQRACNAHTAALAQERDALRIEYESRALWIAEMNRILGHDNSDGFHSEPDPHTLARQLVAEWAKGKDERETLRATVARLTAELANATKLLENRLTLAEERCERLTAERDRLGALLTEVVRWHADPESSDYNECETDPCAWCEQAKAALAPTQKEEA